MSLESVYLIALFVSGAAILLYMLFGDVLDGAGEFFNPTLILAFITIGSAAGYIFEAYSSMNSVFILLISCVIAFIITAGLNLFILIPLSSAEESLAYTEQSLKGRIGKVITSIPEDGFGEVLIENASGRIAKPATGYKKEAIQEGTNVLIVEAKNGVLYVTMYDDLYKEGF
nr:NfeD family protein [Bacillus benzoevorans]